MNERRGWVGRNESEKVKWERRWVRRVSGGGGESEKIV